MNIRQLRAAATALIVSAGMALPAVAVQVQIALQGTLINPNNNQPYTGAQAAEFKIYQGGNATTAGSGTLVYDETVTVTPAASGVFSHPLGSGTPIGPALSTAAFDTSQAVYIEIAIGGTVLLPRLQLLGSPYASIAGIAESLKSGSSITYGLSVGTLNVTGTGSTTFSVVTASGVQINGGTLEVNGSGGVSVRGGIVASTGTFTATGNTQPSLTTSSGIVVNAGGVTAPFFNGTFYGTFPTIAGPPPIGALLAYAGSTEPSGWVECDGRSIAQSGTAVAAWGNYNTSALFTAIGTVWGSAGAGVFNIPDMRGIFPRGWNHAKGAGSFRDPDAASRTNQYASGATGDAVGSYQVDELESHTHTYTSASGGGSFYSQGSAVIANTTLTSSATGGNETRPTNAYVMYIIRVQ
jgi:microcystin-dependent protein